MRAAVLLLALTAAGCVTRIDGRRVDVPAPEPPATAGETAGEKADLDLRIECDRARVVVPESRRDGGFTLSPGGPPWTVAVGALSVSCRESPPDVVVAGEDLSVVAEGIVLLSLGPDPRRTEEGPFRTVILRNGNMVRR